MLHFREQTGDGMNKIELTEDQLKAMLRDAFNAGCAFTVGSHKDFKQTHPNCNEFVDKYVKGIE